MPRLNILTAARELRAITQSSHNESAVTACVLQALCAYFDARYSIYTDCRSGKTVTEHIATEQISEAESERVTALITNERSLTTQAQTYEQPRIINDLNHCHEFATLSALPRHHVDHLLIIPLKYRHQTYAVIYILRHENQTVFLEREREFAFSLALYLGASWGEDIARHRALYTRSISAGILQRTYTDFDHYRCTKQIAETTQSVVGVVGEAGVGKTRFVEYIHALASPLGTQMLTIDCSWLASSMPHLSQVESAPTVLILHIDALNPQQQRQLIELLQTERAHERARQTFFIEVTTSQHLKTIPDAIAYLVKPIVSIEPLRKNPAQIVRIFRHLLETDERQPRVTTDIEQQLVAHQWSGNMAELMHIYAHSKELPENQEGEALRIIDLFHFEQHYRLRSLKEAMSNYRKNYIASALNRYHGNQTHTAKALNIQRTYLNKLLNTWYKSSEESSR